MDNRDRDKGNKNTSSTSGGSINRNTSSKQGKVDSDSNADFGQDIGKSDEWKDQPSRRSGSGSSRSSSSGRSGLSSGGGRRE